jgi:Rrf2 family iron-sulfur cluster assembly transcriptional regulator
MRLSTRGRYAVMAMVELAVREGAPCADRPSSRPVSLAEIAQAQLLSLAYLEQLFGRLRRAGLVASARGPGGGYRLGRPCTEVTIAEIVEAADEPITATRCEAGSPGCLAGQRCLTHDLWAELGEQIRLFLAGVTLADVVAGHVPGRARGPLPAETQKAEAPLP